LPHERRAKAQNKFKDKKMRQIDFEEAKEIKHFISKIDLKSCVKRFREARMG
jgi:cell fate (sporulation/competence/biofilm development) regulator YlbF (YheA/YmcA/DUF963 family)